MGLRGPVTKAEAGLPITVPPVEMIGSPLVICGDVVMVTRLDRLARSIRDLFAIINQGRRRQGAISVCREPWADTGT
jgi:hypothetical protein